MNGQKTPFNLSINRNAQRKAEDAIQQTGKALPCSVVAVSQTVGGAIVTVKFEVDTGFTLPNITIPHFGGEWIRYPVQIGDKGIAIPSDTRLNDISGIGSGVADLTTKGNLTGLVFMPIGNANWSAPTSNLKLELYGVDGVIIRSQDGGANYIQITESGITVHGTITVTGDVIADGISLKSHKHGGVQTGGVQTGIPV